MILRDRFVYNLKFENSKEFIILSQTGKCYYVRFISSLILTHMAALSVYFGSVGSMSYRSRKNIDRVFFWSTFSYFPLSVFIVGIFYQTIRRTERSEGSIPCILHNLASMLCKSTTCVCVHVSYVSYRRREKMIVYCIGRHFL
jgi:hypothetical protein